MRATDGGAATPTDGRDAAPLELEWMYDDAENPTEVTIFAPGREAFLTEWLTADRSTAVSLAAHR